VIQDLDGATSEPSRRRHVAVLSAATAAISLVLLYVVLAPPAHRDAAPQAAAPSPSPSFIGWEEMLAIPVASSLLQHPPLDPPAGICYAGASGEIQLGAFVAGRSLTTVVYDRTGRFPIAFVQEQRGTGRLVLTCTNPDSFMPRIDRAR
jgi:hypothetical protein